MGLKFICLLSLLVLSDSSFALTPSLSFKPKETFDSVKNFSHEKEDIDLSVMSTDIQFSDLNNEGIKELSALFETKKDYGKMFGFKEWAPVRQKLFQDATGRTFILEGHYKDANNKIVNFLEVYWASKTNAGLFLITSNSKKLALEDMRDLSRINGTCK